MPSISMVQRVFEFSKDVCVCLFIHLVIPSNIFRYFKFQELWWMLKIRKSMGQLTVKTVITGFVGNHKTPYQLNLFGRKEGDYIKYAHWLQDIFYTGKKDLSIKRSEKIV